MKLTRFKIAQPDIIKHFNNTGKSIFTYMELAQILNENSAFWRLPINMNVKGFYNELNKIKKMENIVLAFPNRKISLFSWGKPSLFQIALSFTKSGYLSHYSAMYIHNLTNQVPKSIYINIEQTLKSKLSGELSQENIGRAFSREQRMTNNIAVYENIRFILLNGKNTGRMGVEEIEFQNEGKIAVTNIERTLIDITVRPAYSGGVPQVLEAYRAARESAQINKLVAMYEKLEYIYPYHQAIGFYLEKAGYRESQIELLKRFEIKYNFYLANNMKETSFSERWKIFFPKGL